MSPLLPHPATVCLSMHGCRRCEQSYAARRNSWQHIGRLYRAGHCRNIHAVPHSGVTGTSRHRSIKETESPHLCPGIDAGIGLQCFWTALELRLSRPKEQVHSTNVSLAYACERNSRSQVSMSSPISAAYSQDNEDLQALQQSAPPSLVLAPKAPKATVVHVFIEGFQERLCQLLKGAAAGSVGRRST